MTRKLRQIIACLTDDGDILSVLNFSDTGARSNGDVFQTDCGRQVTRISEREFQLSQTGQRMTTIRRGHDQASALH